jgi:hypothetical protein
MPLLKFLTLIIVVDLSLFSYGMRSQFTHGEFLHFFFAMLAFGLAMLVLALAWKWGKWSGLGNPVGGAQLPEGVWFRINAVHDWPENKNVKLLILTHDSSAPFTCLVHDGVIAGRTEHQTHIVRQGGQVRLFLPLSA